MLRIRLSLKRKKKKPDTETGKKKLTLKQKRFIDNYIISGNATDAAIKAGYSKKTAAQCGADNLRKLYIKQAIDEQLKKIEDKKIATADEVLKFITSVVRGEVKDPVVVTEGRGDGYSLARIINKPAGLKERLSAAKQLMKRYGLFTDKVEIKDTTERINPQHEEILNAIRGRKVEGFNDE